MALISPTQSITLNEGDGIEIDENQPNRDFTISNLHRYVPGIYMTSIVESPANTFTFNVPRVPDYEFFPGTNMTSIVQGPLDKFTFNNPTYTFVAGTNMTSVVQGPAYTWTFNNPAFPTYTFVAGTNMTSIVQGPANTWTFNAKERFQVFYMKLLAAAANVVTGENLFPEGTVTASRSFQNSALWLPHTGSLKNFRMKAQGMDANDAISLQVSINSILYGPIFTINQASPQIINDPTVFNVTSGDDFCYQIISQVGNPFASFRNLEVSIDYYF